MFEKTKLTPLLVTFFNSFSISIGFEKQGIKSDRADDMSGPGKYSEILKPKIGLN